jgi:para-nitrobenzyl esterase
VADRVGGRSESGGAVGVCTHMTSPTPAGLFDRAIMESGNCLLA